MSKTSIIVLLLLGSACAQSTTDKEQSTPSKRYNHKKFSTAIAATG
jgi:hypothetical protein